jgi:hypothetical protein
LFDVEYLFNAAPANFNFNDVLNALDTLDVDVEEKNTEAKQNATNDEPNKKD